MKVSTSYHSDIADAVLYAWRECRHFYEADVKPAKKTPNEYMLELEEKEAQALEDAKVGNEPFTDVNTYEDLGISEFDDWDS
jgi:hypothetical protein